MSRELSKTYEPRVIEERWAKFWVGERLFDVPTGVGTQGETKKFTMLLPPPNVTGRLHMGHMLNQTEMDILTRWHRMRGETAAWVPGTDHAGIATQMMVERQMVAEGVTREGVGREEFTRRVWAWKCMYGGAITEQMRRLGASVDWSREYFTMDEGLSVAVKEAFVRLWEQGLIYRGAYIVNWDPAIQTAVSDLEVEHEERLGKLYFVRYPLADGTGEIVVATTRPETMLGDVAVAVNPTDERYRAMVGKRLRLPLSGVNGGTEREIPVVADDWANPEFGTGAVKVTPAHDPNDFAIGQRHGLENRTILDERARVSLAGSVYDGMDRFAARERMVADLEAAGLLVEVKDHAMSVGVSQRSGVVIEPRLSQQWFVKIAPLAEKAIRAVEEGHIRFTPEQYRKTYEEWMRNIHDWCISRQLLWGHRIPAWHCRECKGITVTRDPEGPAECEHCGSEFVTQETDVLDTWFSSGLLPISVFGWSGGDAGPSTPLRSGRDDSGGGGEGVGGAGGLTAGLAEFYPTDLLVTGFDILFFWVARMVMLGTHLMMDVPMANGSARTLGEAVPFREVYIHALVRAEDRQKMSKTKGNVVDPIDMIERFGTDAVRFTLASMASPGTDIAFSEARTEGNRAFANKIWNAARFLFMNLDRAKEAGFALAVTDATASLGRLPEGTPLESRWMVARLGAVAAEVERALSVYRFDEAASAVYQFFWGELCDWYLELIKLRLDFSEGAAGERAKEPGTEEKRARTEVSLGVLVGVFEAALRLLSPFMPFLTEEIWQALYDGAPPAKSIALTRYPVVGDFPADAEAERGMATMQELIATVRGLRKEMGIPEKEVAPIVLYAGDRRMVELVEAHADMLARMCRVPAVEFAGGPLTGAASRSTAEFDVRVVYARQIDVAAERERLTKDLAKYEKGLAAAERQLGNEAFMGKAPAHIVEGLRKQAAETRGLYDKARGALAELPEV